MKRATVLNEQTRPTKAKPMDQLLAGAEGGLKALLDQLAHREGLDHTLGSVLPASLARQTQVGRLHGATLELVADNAACATRLRYLNPQILQQLHQAGYLQITALQIRLRGQ